MTTPVPPPGFVIDKVGSPTTDRPPPPPPGFVVDAEIESPGMVGGVLQAGAQGATLGFSDEIQAGVAAGVAKVFGPILGANLNDQTFGQLMDEAKKSLRGESEAFAKENPKTALAATVAGGLVTAKPALGLLTKARIPTTGVRGVAASGAAIGTVAGTGVAEKGKRLEGAAKGLALGAGFGLAFSGIAGVGSALKQRFAPGIANRIRAIAEQSGLTPSQIATRLGALGPKATLADVAEVFQRAADVTAGRLGPAAQKVRELIRRDETQFGRLIAPIRRTLGSVDEAVTTVNDLKDARIARSSPLYERAFSQVLEQTNTLKDLLTRPVTRAAWRKVQSIGKSDPELDISLLSDGADPSFRGWQKITMELSDKIATLRKHEKFGDAAIIGRLRKKILSELDNQSGEFREARAMWAGTKRADDMLELGADFLKMSPSAIKEEIKTMSVVDKQFYRLGAGRAIEERLQTGTDTNDLARMFRNEAFREKAIAVFPDKRSAVDFINTVKAETIKKTTTNLVGRGSQTQPRQAVERQLGGKAIGPEDASLTGIARKLLQNVGGAKERTIQGIGNLLLSQSPAAQQRAIRMMVAEENPLLRLGSSGVTSANVGTQATR